MLRTVLYGVGATLALALSSMGWCAPEISTGPAQSGLRIQFVEFEPIGAGKNVAHVSVANPTAEQRGVLIDVLTNGQSDLGRQFFTVVRAGETRNVRCVFPLFGPVATDATVRLRFYDSASAKSFDDSQYFQQQLVNLTELPLKTPAELKALPQSESTAAQVRQVFRTFQRLIRQQKYGKVWDALFTQDYREGCFQSLDMFAKAMAEGDDSACLFFWDRETLLDMRPVSVSSAGDLLVLSVTNGKETWHINCMPSESGWRIDWIGGYVPAILLDTSGENWWSLLLANTQVFNTEHFEIHYFTNSTAERELSALAKTRERGYAGIVAFLGVPGLPVDRKIRLFLFEDMKAKRFHTGSVGMGIAGNDGDGNDIMLEVYGKKNRLDPYHETTHIIMNHYSEPPAILNEGLATYMSERLGGASALRYLGGRDQALSARVREFKQNGEWINLQELLAYTNIGTQGSRTTLAYVEAGALVKYLIETYGKEKFLEAYKTLTNSEDPDICRRNQEKLEQIYESPLQKLEEDWVREMK